MTRVFAGIVLSLTTAATNAATFEIDATAFAPSANVITFETGDTGLTYPPGVSQFVEDSVSGLPRGAHWFNGSFSFVNLRRQPNPAFGLQAFGNLVSAPGYSDLAIVFASPVQAVGGWLAPDALGTTAHVIDFRVLGATGNVLGSTTVTLSTDYLNQLNDAFRFAGLASTDGIYRAEWRIVGDTTNEGFFSVDNVTFGAIVPIPSTIWLLITGIAALGGRNWMPRQKINS